MTTEQAVRAAVDRVLGPAAQTIHVITFPGGNASLTITIGEHTAVLDGEDSSGWGWTVDPGTDDGFTGHEQVADTLEAALTQIRQQLSA
ncbi:hypothetical protein ACFXGT_08110 [Streptomyces sp. NPDC059352]|uniref:hypothetical protein n=1 Tax=Streptomyces sp. NPDC059352 TaxID=3346810 RepID=UPI0036B8E6D4